jgi:hypothetical protein
MRMPRRKEEASKVPRHRTAVVRKGNVLAVIGDNASPDEGPAHIQWPVGSYITNERLTLC